MTKVSNENTDVLLGAVICPCCSGEGNIYVSSCCGAEPRGNGDCDSSDFGICPDCKDHCEYGAECEECDGKGQIIAS